MNGAKLKPRPAPRADAGLRAVFTQAYAATHKSPDGYVIRNAADLAKALAVSRQALSNWTQIPPEHVLKLEEMLGVPAYVQRGDLYRPPPNSQ